MEALQKLQEGNRRYVDRGQNAKRLDTAKNGQHPYGVVICCSDSRVIPEQIFDAQIGDLFVIRVAGNVLDDHQLGSVEYAVSHLGCKLVVLLGHTGCGAVDAAIRRHRDGFIGCIVKDILSAIGEETDPLKACEQNVRHGVQRLQEAFFEHPEAGRAQILGAVYDIVTGEVRFL